MTSATNRAQSDEEDEPVDGVEGVVGPAVELEELDDELLSELAAPLVFEAPLEE